MTERQHKTKRSIYLYTCQQTNPICQQELRGCRQTFDRHPTFCFIIFMIFHILIGIISIGFTNDIREYKIRYDDKCGLSETNPTGTADIYFNNPPLSGNIFFYFELHDYYQTYFLMARHLSIEGIRGRLEDYPVECETNNKTTIACEIFNKIFFLDCYEILNGNFSELDITWRHTKGNLYKEAEGPYEDSSNWILHPNVSDYFSGEALNEHFIVWMRIAAKPNFRKLYSKSSDGCPANLHVHVHCFYPYTLYHGERYLVLLKPDGLGGKSLMLAIFNFILSGVIVVFIVAFETIKLIHSKKIKRRVLKNNELVIESIEVPDDYESKDKKSS